MRLQDQLNRAIGEKVDEVAPAPDLNAVLRRGRGLRRRRAMGVVATAAVAACCAVVLVQAISPDQLSVSQPSAPQRFAAVGRLDYTEGLRAFASPDEDGRLSLGGRYFPRTDMGYLDTDATATPYGVVFFDRAWQVHLLGEDGTDTTLAPAPAQVGVDFRASSKADAQLPLVAFTQPGEYGVDVVLHNLRAQRTVDTRAVPCSGEDCTNVVVDGVDRGLVFVRTGDGTFVWDPQARGEARWTRLGEGKFRVADVRNGRLMWYGAPPLPAPLSPVADWSFNEGPIDAQLSFDGRHILYWSPRLEPTTPGDRAVELDVKEAIWFTFDTDGSVLAASNGPKQQGVFYDCEIPSGTCTEIGRVSTMSGDPMFIGNDM